MTGQEAVNGWSNPRLEPILIGIYEDDMGDGYAKRLAAETALVELERERAALVAERDDWKRQAEQNEEARALWMNRQIYEKKLREQAVAERDANQRKVDAYDAARAVVKIEGNSRAYYVLRAENAEAIAEQAVAERDRYRDAVEEAEARLGLMPIAIRQKTLRAFERHALAAYQILRAALAVSA